LLEEKGDVGSTSAIAKVPHPIDLHRSMIGSGFPADDQPVDRHHVQRWEWAEEWLGTDEPYGRGRGSQRVRAADPPVELDRGSEPDVRQWLDGPLATDGAREPVAHPIRALREDLIGVLLGSPHRLEDPTDEFVWYQLVPQVAHRIHEDHPRLFPRNRDEEPGLVDHDVLGRVCRRPGLDGMAEPKREAFRVAMSAAGADLRASGDRVPSRVRPLDR
jgi:hypothetical protein